MPDAPAPTRTPGRRTVRYATPAEVLADVARLRAGGYRQVGQWSLPQACHHLAVIISGNLTPPADDAPPTAEQLAMKEKFFGMVRGGMPEGIPSGATTPPADCPDSAVDDLAAAFAKLAAYPHTHLMVGRCGPVPTAEVAALHLDHCAHHLSFLTPTPVRRTLRFASAADVAADVRRLRGGYVRSGHWTLPQACWHLLAYTRAMLARPITEATPEMAAQRPLMEAILAGGPIPDGRPLTDDLVPPATAGEADVDAFLAFLDTFEPRPAMHRTYGPVTAEQMAGLFLAHCAHHLSFLVPTTARRSVRFASAADVAADVRHLCDGYVRSAKWTLPQACWHLSATTQRMLARPMGEPSAEQVAARPIMAAALAGQPLPDGLAIPPELDPPASAGRADVDAFLAFLDGFQPRSAMHLRFGPITAEQMGMLFLAHCGHHLSHLVPDPGGLTCPPAA